MANMVLNTNGVAGADIPAYTIVKYGAADGAFVPSAAATNLHVGVSESIDVVSGQRVDVCRVGIAAVKYGGTVTRGQKLTSDANGAAVATTTTGDHVIGTAEVSGASGDIGAVLLAPGVY